MARPMGSLVVSGLSIAGATTVATAHQESAADRARRHVAGVARDAEDCALLLDMLGLVPDGMELKVRLP